MMFVRETVPGTSDTPKLQRKSTNSVLESWLRGKRAQLQA